MKTHLTIGVRELVEFGLRSGDIESDFVGASRALDAIRIHQRIQLSRPAGYVPEVRIGSELDRARFVLTLSGRIDGVLATDAAPVIEEIKTTRRSLEECIRSEHPLHWGQAKVYAFLYAVQHGLAEIGVQLTYARLDSGKTREVRRHFTRAELEVFFEEVVGRYIEWAEQIADWHEQRDASLHRLTFPFHVFRPGQQEMLTAVADAIRDGGRTFIQAATGIGKTMAVLFPALQSMGEGACAKIFYLTARTTGRLAAEKALDELRRGGLRVKSLALTAKERICFRPGRLCRAEECEFAKGHYDRLPAARRTVFATDGWHPQAVAAAARAFQVCPFEFALDLARWSDLIVGDYNYAFDPRAYLRRFFGEPAEDYIFLVDEAHNLVDRSREMFSAELRRRAVAEVRRTVKGAVPAVHRRLGKINRWMLQARRRCEETGGGPLADRDPPEDLEPLLRDFLQAAERWLEKNIAAAFRRSLLEMYFEVGGFLRVAELFSRDYAVCYEPADDDLRLRLFCIDPSRQISEALNRCRAAVFFSATLAPLDYFQTMLGCEAAANLTLPSPFPPENLGVFIAERLSTYYRHRQRTQAEVARLAQRLVQGRKGNYLIFFPSYEYLRLVLGSFQAAAPDMDIIVQSPGMSERQREEFLARFAVDNPRTLVGFAVLGGIFGEGIDLVGSRLSGAAVVGVGLPAVGLERELIREHFAARLEQGFEYAYLFPGINRVLQAAGRVIRSETDRGVVLLIDQRYGTEHYRALLPQEWNIFRLQDPAQLAAELHAFWDDGPR